MCPRPLVHRRRHQLLAATVRRLYGRLRARAIVKIFGRENETCLKRNDDTIIIIILHITRRVLNFIIYHSILFYIIIEYYYRFIYLYLPKRDPRTFEERIFCLIIIFRIVYYERVKITRTFEPTITIRYYFDDR